MKSKIMTEKEASKQLSSSKSLGGRNETSGIFLITIGNKSPKKSKFKDSEIDQKVEEYRQKLNEEMLRMISLEKERDEERKSRLTNIEDEEEKKQLEDENNVERNKAADEIAKKNE